MVLGKPMILNALLIITVFVIGLASPLLWMLSFERLGIWAVPLWIAVVIVAIPILGGKAGTDSST